MKQYGKITNNQLITPKSISLGGGQFITNPTDEQYIAHGYKEVIDIQPTFTNYERSYTETDTQIIVNYTEVIITEQWGYETAYKIKMNSDSFVAMTSEVNAILPDLSNNVSMMGVTEIYLDVIDEELETLLKYFDSNLVIIERK